MSSVEVFTDGGSKGNPGPASIAAVIVIKGRVFEIAARSIGEATNNQAEYQALRLATRLIEKNSDIDAVTFYLDSELVVKQMQGAYKIKDGALQSLAVEIQAILRKFAKVEFKYIAREKNEFADHLVNYIGKVILDRKS